MVVDRCLHEVTTWLFEGVQGGSANVVHEIVTADNVW